MTKKEEWLAGTRSAVPIMLGLCRWALPMA